MNLINRLQYLGTNMWWVTQVHIVLKCSGSHIYYYKQKLAGYYPSIGRHYPKLHSLSHLVDIIRRKGTTDNYHTGLGEALHPQSKKDYKHTNHQETFKEQVSYPPILEICPQVDSI